jgi:NADH-quinone oxidoreductase subunit E
MKDERVPFNRGSDSECIAIIDTIVHKNNHEIGAAIMILQQIQSSFGYVSPAMLERVSQWTGISTSALYSIVTFYAQFRLEPVGENVIKVCHGTACHLAGAEKITEAVEIETVRKQGKPAQMQSSQLKKLPVLVVAVKDL